MSTTTIRIDSDLKSRLAVAADRAGKSAHAFIVDTLAETVARDEQETALQDLAETRWAGILATGETVAWDDAKTWLEARARGELPTRLR
jgi:predicted transcriptional regulator